MINFAIVEDDNELREHIKDYLSEQEGFGCIYSVDSVESLMFRLQPDELPDIILMDIGLPGMSGIEGMKLLKEKYPGIELIVITVYEDPKKIFDALCAGASGYLLKNAPFSEIKSSIEISIDGGAPMSPQIARKVISYFQPKEKKKSESPLSVKEKEVVIGLVDGLSYKQIAERMYISAETIRSHIKNIYRKLQVHSKAEVISKSFRNEI